MTEQAEPNAGRLDLFRAVARMLAEHGDDHDFAHGFNIGIKFAQSQVSCLECAHEIEVGRDTVAIMKSEILHAGGSNENEGKSENGLAVN